MHDADGNPITGFLVLVIAVLSASGAAWLWIFRRWQAGQPPLEFEPRRPVPWGVTDAVLMLLGWLMLQALLPALLRTLLGMGPVTREGPKSPEDLRVLMLGILSANGLAGICAPLWLWFGRGARAADLGLSRLHLAADLRRGAVAFAAVAVPVYAIQMVLTQFFPSHHPLVELLQETQDTATVVLSVLIASVAAPIVEEVLFRLVLQGGLETAEARALAAVDPPQPIAAPAMESETPGSADNAYAAPRTLDDPANSSGNSAAIQRGSSPAGTPEIVIYELPKARVWGLPAGIWPILISSAIFALMHWQHGPDPIPLFVLAVVLGYLYRQTHRIGPSIVVHMLLNSCSLAAFWLQPGK
jgi:membrane protease YdiL (CAAX protease family)